MMGGTEISNKNDGETKKRNAKGHHDKRRLQLFDPSSKADLIKLCDGGGLVQLNLDNDRENNVDGGNDNSASLNFEEESSGDEVEPLPIDKNARTSEQQVQQLGLLCGSCNIKFSDLTEQRLHYTLDWHRYNVKRKLHGEGCVTEAKFDELLDDLSSIDGSDNEEEEATTAGVQQHVDRLLEKLNVFGANHQQSHKSPPEQPNLSRSQKLEKSPKAFFKNSKGQIIACFKAVLSPCLDSQEGSGAAEKLIHFVQSPLRITIIMASGGHFAAAVFEGNSCTHHKTFHSYTVRAKQGGSQGSHDSKSGTSNAKSAGASLRRYNQQSFAQHVQDLLSSWRKSIAESNLVFYKAISGNASLLFTGKNPPLNKESKSLRTIPFPTKRPTFNEVKRVHSLLTTLNIYESMDSFLDAHSHFVKKGNEGTPGSPSKLKNKKAIDRARSRSPKRKDELEFRRETSEEDEETHPEILEEFEHTVDLSELKEYDDSLTPEQRKDGQKNRKRKSKKTVEAFQPEGIMGELADALRQNNLETFGATLAKIKETGQSAVINQQIDVQSSTLLHIASKSNQLEFVWNLMDAGCDPAIKDKSGKCPYNYADSRECRDVFRKFMGDYPDKYDYKKAQVPPPLSEEMEKERAEKKKLLNKLKREKEKQKKMEKKEKEKETEEQRRFLNLSDREKRALAAEQRILAQCKRNAEKPPVLVRCFDCAADMTGKVPFEYNQNVFCSTKCLTAHRKKFPCPLSVN